MNLKDFKKVGATGSHTIFEHPDGHLIHISNSNIPASLKKEMREIPMEESPMEKLRQKMAKGGMVKKYAKGTDFPIGDEEEEDDKKLYTSASPTQDLIEQEDPFTRIPTEELLQRELPAKRQAPVDYLREGLSDIFSPPEEQTGLVGVKAEQARFEQQQPKAPSLKPDTAAAPSVPTKYDSSKFLPKTEIAAQPEAPAQPSAYEKELQVTAETGERIKSIQEQAASQEAMAYQTAASNLQNLAVKASSEKQRLQKMMNQVNQSIMDNEIDPNRYMGNMSTLGRISTTIGLILGGIGQGMTGGRENLAFKALESAIDRDVEAQKLDLNKKNNLLTAYYKMYGDIEQAEAATKAQIMSLVQLKTNQIAAQSKSAQAVEQGKLFQAQIRTKGEQYENQQSQLAADKALSEMTKSTTATRPTDEQVMSYIDRRNLPDKQKEKLKEDYTELMVGQEQMVIFKNLMNDQYELSRISSMKDPLQRYDLLKTYAIALAPQVKDVTGETRMSDQEFRTFVEPLISKFYTSPETLRKQINIMLSTKSSQFKKYETSLKGIGLHGYGMPVMGESIPTTKK